MNTTTMASSRLLSAAVLAEALQPDQPATPLRTAHRALGVALDRDIGLWEAGPGTDVDTEIDELFVVLSGAGTLTFADGSTIELRPGVLVKLHAGDTTTWDITERLCKLYLA